MKLIKSCFLLYFICHSFIFAETKMTLLSPRLPALQQQIDQALLAKGKAYKARTEHLNKEGQPIYTNRLILEASPYLLQHAHNPVDWFPWGDEAFAKAKKENKPIFLSIGYSTCHWCHVMERESFENPQIAQLINQYFVPIKVDREQRPDIDEIYMTAVMLTTGSGGWPMSSFITPEGKTFYGGTYFPPPRFSALLKKIHQVWLKDEKVLRQQADNIAVLVSANNSIHSQIEKLDNTIFATTINEILTRYDDFQGGFGSTPKFPHEPFLYYALNSIERDNNPKLKAAIIDTLEAMANGGIYDQVGGGFHRYSTDSAWLVPHFEKMLYNQAHLSRNYLNAWRLTGNPSFKRVTEQTLDYILRDMTAPQGGFYSASDADSDEEEGLYFTWTLAELNQVLTKPEVELMIELYNVTKQGNFEGRNIFALEKTLEKWVKAYQKPEKQWLLSLQQIHNKLYQQRETRPKPLTDNKILTAWNGMMISAFAQAGQVLNNPKYSQAAITAGNFIWTNLYQNKQLKRAYLDNKASIPASQEDYAYLAEAFIYLYHNTLDKKWLERAIILTDQMIEKFWDTDQGAFFMSAQKDHSNSMGRPKDMDDNAIPSGNSVALHVLTLLSKRTESFIYQQKAAKMISVLAKKLKQAPSASAYMLMAIEYYRKGEIGGQQFAAKGHIEMQTDLKGTQLTITLNIAKDWHINSNKPLDKSLIPTQLSIADLTDIKIHYPPAEEIKLGYSKEKLSLYQNTIKITTDLPETWLAKNKPYFKVKLKLQACNHKSCLAPETLVLTQLNH